MPKIYLSPSTQEYNITLSGNSEEYYMNLIANAMIPYLRASGIEYGRNTPDMTALSSAEQANADNYDFYLAIHSNASPPPLEGRVRGAEVYYYPSGNDNYETATLFANNYKEIYPLPDFVKTVPLETLIELNKTRMPAILFEVAYHDNPQDFEWMSRNINEIAKNLALSVADYFGVPFIEPTVSVMGIVSINSGNLNVRSGPSINTDIVGKLQNGDTVEVLENENDWFKIRSDGLSGYVSSRFIKAL